MIYIDISKLKVSKSWKRRAKRALDEVAAIIDTEKRSESIDRNSGIWRELKDALKELSKNKCWYCECLESRSDTDVDHFRPKNEVSEDETHGGYWWLAFDYTNYRHSCIYCNRHREKHGKRAQFPLLDPTKRAKTEDDDITQEKPVLLDPTVKEDPECLWFMENGEVVPAFDEAHNRDKYYRAEKSIDIYHLMQAGLTERRLDKIRQVKDLIEDYEEIKKLCGTNPLPNRANTIKQRLKELIDTKSEYSACTMAYLISMRDNDHEWIGEILT